MSTGSPHRSLDLTEISEISFATSALNLRKKHGMHIVFVSPQVRFPHSSACETLEPVAAFFAYFCPPGDDARSSIACLISTWAAKKGRDKGSSGGPCLSLLYFTLLYSGLRSLSESTVEASKFPTIRRGAIMAIESRKTDTHPTRRQSVRSQERREGAKVTMKTRSQRQPQQETSATR